jgi:hypothetical protein
MGEVPGKLHVEAAVIPGKGPPVHRDCFDSIPLGKNSVGKLTSHIRS